MNMAMEHNPVVPEGHHNTRGEGRHLARWILIVTLFVVVGFTLITIINYGYRGLSVYGKLNNVQEELANAKVSISDQDFDAAVIHLAAAETNASEAQADFRQLKFTRLFPIIGEQYSAANNLINATTQLIRSVKNISLAVQEISKPLQDVEVVNFQNLSEEQKGAVLQGIHQAAPMLEGARSELELAKLEVDKVPGSGVLRQIKKYANEIERIVPLLDQVLDVGVSFSKVGPDLVGYPVEKRYLVLFLNNTELRPGGGFIGSYGVLSVKNGEISSFPTNDVYDLDNNFTSSVTPPDPIKQYLAPQWYFRDSNWSPDYPTSAEKSLEFYRLESGDDGRIDGVIGITPSFIKNLLTLVGEVRVDGYPYTFTSENFTQELQDAVEFDFVNLGLSEAERKSILGDLNRTLMSEVLGLPQDRWPDLLSILFEEVQEKHIAIHLTDSIPDKDILAPVLRDSRWDGHVQDIAGDYFMLVDANFYGLKSDPYVKRSIDYQVQWTNENKAIARAVITYDHTGFRDNKFIDSYQTYSRVLAPLGSTLISSDNTDTDVDVIEEAGKTSFGFLKRIEPQETEIIVLEYELPQSIVSSLENNAYTLNVQKQIGAYDNVFSLTFQGPRKFMRQDPIEIPVEKISNQQVRLSTTISTDREIQLYFE